MNSESYLHFMFMEGWKRSAGCKDQVCLEGETEQGVAAYQLGELEGDRARREARIKARIIVPEIIKTSEE